MCVPTNEGGLKLKFDWFYFFRGKIARLDIGSRSRESESESARSPESGVGVGVGITHHDSEPLIESHIDMCCE